MNEIEQIRARLADRYVHNNYGRREKIDPLPDIATLLAHSDAQDRAIAAHKRDEEQRAEMEQAAFENGRKVALDEIRAVLTPEAIDELTCSISDARAARDARIALRKTRRLLHD